jgi:hypothetical protein
MSRQRATKNKHHIVEDLEGKLVCVMKVENEKTKQKKEERKNKSDT